MKWFKEQGWAVHIAASGEIELPYVDQKYNIPIQRSPFHRENVKAYKQLKTLINRNKYHIVHCHTPMGGVLARLAAREARESGTTVMYTAHGFHFCKGAPLLNWMIYYPIEKCMAHYTDCLITINKEDYELATRRFKAKHVEYVHGVGVNTEKFKPIKESKKVEIKKSFGYKADDFLLFYAAEFNKNKNQEFLLQVLALLKDDIPNAKLLLAGEGPMLEKCREQAVRLGVSQMVDFLGYRQDIQQIIPMCDMAIASSFREGLPVNIMEAMACGLPVVAIDNRGHRELVQNNKNGWIIERNNTVDFSNKIKVLAHTEELKRKLGENGRNIILNKYSVEKILTEKSRIYQSYLTEHRPLNILHDGGYR